VFAVYGQVLADRHGVSFDDLFPDDEFDISFLKSANIGNDWTLASREKAVLAFLGEEFWEH
jgi:hypothetical protein